MLRYRMERIYPNFLSVTASAAATATATVIVVSKKDYDDNDKQQIVIPEKIAHTKDSSFLRRIF